MFTITYRPYEPRDAEGVMAIVLDAFHIRSYAPRPYLERSAAELFLSERLLTSTYAQVAVVTDDRSEDDDEEPAAERVVGVLMGRVEDEPPLPARPLAHAHKLAAMAWLATAGMPQWDTLTQALGFDYRRAELRQDVLLGGGVAVTDEITLLAVHPAWRGRGVGTRLYDDFMEHLHAHGRKDFFLYADSLCSYEFCEQQGLSRAATRELRLDVPDLPEKVEVYLYTGEVPTTTTTSAAAH
ncbi:GNAT family N-acetyltransferase [Actinomyces sp. 594]|uniref:GNAT family N-acetyltransferase n=1 Tax=Actinomyces sp. 594 TaxID=2057793 RepID=UPI001C581901|nr:GNAT family N-acetyltransferase [Actinomyces sp. 594]MBW3069995.1 GNAT family N-acetyltransferase [Actinomyces sp. 594]